MTFFAEIAKLWGCTEAEYLDFNMEIREELRRFYRALQELIDRDFADPPEWFDPKGGLCENLSYWAVSIGIKSPVGLQSLRNEQRDHFEAAGLDKVYPFNSDWAAFEDEMVGGLPWKNPARLAFVKNQLEEG